MKKLLWCVVSVALAFVSTPSFALWGVGDISFDPTTYGEVAKLYSQTKELYETTKKQLKTLDEVRTTLMEAKEGVEALQNFDLKKTAQSLKGSGLDGKDNKIGALRSEMSTLEGKLGGTSSYLQYQKQRIANLEKLDMLQGESAKNVDKASSKTSAEANSKITAQSTSILATLAAAGYSAPIQAPIPLQFGHLFRLNSGTHSGPIRAPSNV